VGRIKEGTPIKNMQNPSIVNGNPDKRHRFAHFFTHKVQCSAYQHEDERNG